MHILWIKTELLHPVDKGGRIRTYQMLRALRREHRITYLTLDDGTAAPDALARAEEYCHEVVRVPFAPPAKGTAGFYLDLARNLASRLPYAVAKYRSRELRRRVTELTARGDVDVVVCDFLFPSLNVPDGLPVPTVLFQHNVEAMIWERHAAVAAHPVKRAYMGAQWRRMRRFERAECRRFDRVVAVSAQDAETFRTAYAVADVVDVPTGVDIEYFRPSGTITRAPAELVFTGSMDWMPNEDAIRWFAAEVLPRIRRDVAGVHLTVVGRHPTAAVRALAESDPAIRVTGGVPDVRPYIEAASVFVVPIRVGGGTRLKIFEAMAMECPVVSTTIGAEGLPVRPGTDLEIADDAEGFAGAVVGLLRTPDRAATLARTAAAAVRAEYGWDGVARRFGAICQETAGRRVHRRPASPVAPARLATERVSP
ncbi:MAG TPA: glycosyltransferase [Gemmatimonadaceae bacterium]|nr:glycosyltransferase [Gemmatimonadaceae bacterium]